MLVLMANQDMPRGTDKIMEIIGAFIIIPVVIIASYYYSKIAITAYEKKGLLAKIFRIITWVITPILFIELALLVCIGPIKAYHILSRWFYIIHYIAFLAGPAALTNIIVDGIQSKHWQIRNKVIIVSMFCIAISIILIINNVVVSELIYGVD